MMFVYKFLLWKEVRANQMGCLFHCVSFCIFQPSSCSSYLGGTNTPHQMGCLFHSEGHGKGDFVFQTGHVIEIVTKLFLVVQNAVGKAPEVNIAPEFDANFNQQTVLVSFKCIGLPEIAPGQSRIIRKQNKMEVYI
uniref:Uncharacterized protein n=1 Tax=Cacopsylla melanoneura TaxID=428564 RepID=A0A8D8RR95_9HEMI